ncbi:MAG: amidohydrolase [Candidatus Caldarchaeum sp.]|nr:amidohydrolase [Candidatus Caldarchaeum sp.]
MEEISPNYTRALGVVGGTVYQSFKPVKKASGLVALDGRIIFVGDGEKAKRLTTSLNGSLLELDGLTVLPGFVDCHMHIDLLAVSLHSIDLRGVRSIAELKQRLKTHYELNREASWILGRGWDQELFEEKRWPSSRDLDEIVSDKPVILERICGHSAVVNTKAIQSIVGVEPAANPYFLKDSQGNLTGVVVEDAVKAFREAVKFSEKELLEMFHKALLYSASLGVTTLGFVSCGAQSFKILQALRKQNKLPVRVRAYLNMEHYRSLVDTGLSKSFGDEFLKLMGVKVFADGSLGARTAWLSQPYADHPETAGIPTIEKEKLKEIVRECHKAGLQMAIHAIGDKALDMVLDAYDALGDLSSTDHRHRIEHASVMRPEQLERMVKLGVTVTVQPHFVVTDWWVVNRVGERRAGWVYRFRSMDQYGVRIGFSSDTPVEPLNPWDTVYAAVSRGGETNELYKHSKDEAIPINEALHHYTYGSAHVLFEESNIGTLEPGKYADFVIVDKDPLETSTGQLKNIKNLMTVVSGNIVYRQSDFRG